MSLRDRQGRKSQLPRSENEVLTAIEERWAGDDRLRWYRLMLVVIHHNCEWPLSKLALATNRHKGQLSRLIRATRREIRRAIEQDERARPGQDHVD